MKVMKKQLKGELVALAEKVALLKDQDQVATGELKELARRLYEKLTVYNFTESNLYTASEIREQEVVKTAQKVEAPKEKEAPVKASEEKMESLPPVQEEDAPEPDEYNPTGLEFNDSEEITEPNTEKIKDIVAQMPPETQQIDDLFGHIEHTNYKKNDMSDIGGVHYDNLPQFEPVKRQGSAQEKQKSLNDRLKKGINIGLNDRMAFVKHLFDGSTSDYNRVLSQLITIRTKEEAFNFVANMVKPDYNNWEGKEDYESRFLAIVEKNFE
jgi:ABC-type multidrug transport system ATPase subunit